METIINILLAILLISATALCWYLIYYLGKMTKQIELMREDVKTISEKVGPVMDSLSLIGNSLSSIAERLKNQLDDLNTFVDGVKEKYSLVKNVATSVKSGFEDRTQSLIASLGYIRSKLSKMFSR